MTALWRAQNGAFYFTKRAVLERESCRLGGKIALHEMPEHTLTEARLASRCPACRPRRQDWNGELIENGALS